MNAPCLRSARLRTCGAEVAQSPSWKLSCLLSMRESERTYSGRSFDPVFDLANSALLHSFFTQSSNTHFAATNTPSQ